MPRLIFAAVLAVAIGLAGEAGAKRCKDPTTHQVVPCGSVGGAGPGKVAPGTWPTTHCAAGMVRCGATCVPKGVFCRPPR
jgi:hypothetical protein